MNVLAYIIGGGLPAGSLWFVIAYLACKGSFKRELSWLFLIPAWLLVVVCTGIAGVLTSQHGPASPVSSLVDSIAVPLGASLAFTVIAFLATKAKARAPEA